MVVDDEVDDELGGVVVDVVLVVGVGDGPTQLTSIEADAPAASVRPGASAVSSIVEPAPAVTRIVSDSSVPATTERLVGGTAVPSTSTCTPPSGDAVSGLRR